MVRNWQLVAGAVWGLLTLAILLRGQLFEPATLDRIPVRNWSVATFVCGLLAIWNVARWYQANQARRLRAARPALRSNADAPRGYEYNPEFDFQKMDRERADGGAGPNP